MLGWINYALVVGICFNVAISVGVLVLLEWFSSSINNKQYTKHLRRSGSTKGYVIWCGNNIMGGDYTQQYINCRGIVIFVPDDLAYERGGIWIMHNNTSTLSKYSRNLILDIIPLFELSGTRTIGNSTI